MSKTVTKNIEVEVDIDLADFDDQELVKEIESRAIGADEIYELFQLDVAEDVGSVEPEVLVANLPSDRVSHTGDHANSVIEFNRYAHLLSENQWLHILKDVERMTKEERRKANKEYCYDLSEIPTND